jgi:hypothetical protein
MVQRAVSTAIAAWVSVRRSAVDATPAALRAGRVRATLITASPTRRCHDMRGLIPLAWAKPLDERGLDVRFYPGPVWMHQTHKTDYGVQSGNT